MQLTVKALQGRECSLQVSEDELVSTLKHLVSEKLNVPVCQQRLLFKGKALADGKRLSDYSIGPNSKLNLVVKPLEKVLLEESAARKLVEAPPPRPPAWQLIAKILARHFSAADASRVLDQLQRDRSQMMTKHGPEMGYPGPFCHSSSLDTTFACLSLDTGRFCSLGVTGDWLEVTQQSSARART
ncbi:ubiquitin-like protein 4A isoform 2-T2 [Rhynchonycteris naso]